MLDSCIKGATICFRAELDALPIREANSFDYVSEADGIAHLCGHDGHTTILLGLAKWLVDNPAEWKGRVVLIFQPAEETAQGAKAILQDSRFQALKPDYIFALHNLPGFEIGSIILREGIFTSATCGIKIKLSGKTSHAAHPEAGNNPQKATLSIINCLEDLPHTVCGMETPALVTIIYTRLGEIAFGTTPGEAEVMATFRTHDNQNLKNMMQKAEQMISALANAYHLNLNMEWVEEFASVVNDSGAVSMLQRAANTLNLKTLVITSPFPWSEDFSYFSQIYPSALFGLGAGENHPQLHNPDYDFPDELLPVGIRVFAELIRQVNLC